MATKGPQQLRQEAARAQKLEAMKEQIEAGTLEVRQMTAAERKKWPKPPPRPVKNKRPGTQRRGG